MSVLSSPSRRGGKTASRGRAAPARTLSGARLRELIGAIAAIEEGVPSLLRERHEVANLEEVFAAVTGHEIEEGGRIADVRAQRRVARRLG